MYKISIILIFISVFHTIGHAICDGIKDSTGKTLHWLRSITIILLIGSYYSTQIFGFDPFFVIYFILIRYALFDTIYNDITGNDLNYHGSTNHWYVKFLNILPPWVEYTSRAIAFILAFMIAGLYFSNSLWKY